MEEAGEATLEMAQEETPPAKARAASAEAVISTASPSFRRGIFTAELGKLPAFSGRSFPVA